MTEQPTQATAIGELRQLKTMIEEIEASLRSQQEILKKRGMNLPPMAMHALSAIRGDIGRLETALVDDQTELGQLRALSDTYAMINSSLDLDHVLNQALDVVVSLTGAERGYIVLKKPETGALEFRVSRESDFAMPRQGGESEEREISFTVLNEVLETGQPLLADNAYKDERLQGNQSIARFTLRSVLCVPLSYKGVVFGVVYVDNRLRTGVFDQRSKTLLSAFANQASIAVENARLFSSIQQSLLEITQTKELTDNVFASIGSGVVTTDSRTRVTQMNRAASVMLAREEAHALGDSLAALLPGVKMDGALEKVREENESHQIEAEIDVPQRGKIIASVKFSPLKDSQKAVQGVAVVLDDLTDQIAREEVLNTVTTYLPSQLVKDIDRVSKLPLGGERREMTCMYIEPRPIYSYPADYRPQQVMESVNMYLSRSTEPIHRYEGIIDKYMGHEVMALFNSQLNPSHDHALRAVMAALDVRDAFLQLYEELGITPDPHYYRIGINTGIATLGNVGSVSRREFTAIGDTINTAKRIEENASYGQVLISESARDHILKTTGGSPSGLRFGERLELTAKGKATILVVYEVFRN